MLVLFTFIEPYKGKQFSHDFWIHQSQRPAYYAWSGYAFEAVCLKHIDQIVQALGIQANTISSWRLSTRNMDENGAQIDLIIDRSDNALNVCEIKYTDKPFILEKQCAERLRKTIALFKQKTGISKQLFITFISANGLKRTLYSEEMVASVVVLDDLFKR